MAKRDVRPLRVIAALFGVGSALPLGVTLTMLLVSILRRPQTRSFGVDVALIGGALALGPIAVAVTSLLFGLRVRYAGGFHLAALAIAGAFGFFTAGMIALGGGGPEFMTFALALPFGLLSVVLTILVMVQDRDSTSDRAAGSSA